MIILENELENKHFGETFVKKTVYILNVLFTTNGMRQKGTKKEA